MNNTIRRPLRFSPYYKQVIWGGRRISAYKQSAVGSDSVGESWEVSAMPGHESRVVACPPLEGKTIAELIDLYGEDFLGTDVCRRFGRCFPLLIKIIDARENLSLQVHPGHDLAQSRHGAMGKTEMWYVVDTEPDSRIYCGLCAPLQKADLEAAARDGSIMDRVAAYEARPRQFYLVPAGTLHTIGAGNLIIEVQEPSDLTYRLYDFNRTGSDGAPRPLHIAEARDAVNCAYPNEAVPTAEVFAQTTPKAVCCDSFCVDFLQLKDDAHTLDTEGRTFAVVMVTEGALTLSYEGGEEAVRVGETVLLPACLGRCELRGDATALLVYC